MRKLSGVSSDLRGLVGCLYIAYGADIRPTVAGISGNGEVGAWSVALSGGYADE
jgi:hypothetical protein